MNPNARTISEHLARRETCSTAGPYIAAGYKFGQVGSECCNDEKKRTLTFHIGLERTGTNSFQQFCTGQAELLKRYSVLYPTNNLGFGKCKHGPLVASYLNYRDFSIPSSGRTRAEVLRSLLAEIEEAEAASVLISGEHFSSRFRDAEIEQLAADFSDFDCRIAVVVREHRERLYSAYNQSVLSGRAITFDAYCDEVFHPANPYMRYAMTIGCWERVFGPENTSVFCHSPGQDIVPVLGKALISDDLPLPDPGSYWEHLSVSAGATEWLRRVNAAIARVPGSSNPAIRLALLPHLSNLAGVFSKLSRDREQWRLSGQNRQRLNEIIEVDSAWLESRCGIRLAGEAATAAVRALPRSPAHVMNCSLNTRS